MKEREDYEKEELIEREVDVVEEREKEEVSDVVEEEVDVEEGGRKPPMLEVTADGGAGAGKDHTLLFNFNY